MSIPLDEVDRRLLRVLQGDGRITNADLAKACHLSPAACHERVKRLRDRGVIVGYAALLDPAQVDRALYALTNPVFGPVRRIIPSIGGLDISPIIVLLLLEAIQRLVNSWVLSGSVMGV